jgi:hypothetical protein
MSALNYVCPHSARSLCFWRRSRNLAPAPTRGAHAYPIRSRRLCFTMLWATRPVLTVVVRWTLRGLLVLAAPPIACLNAVNMALGSIEVELSACCL